MEAQCGVARSRLFVFIAVLLALFAAASWLMMQPSNPSSTAERSQPTTTASRDPEMARGAASDSPPSRMPEASGSDKPRPMAAPDTVRRDRARRDAIREQIRERQHDASRRNASAKSSAASDPASETPAEGGFVNKMGEEHAELVAAVNRELSTLTDECITAATERGSKLDGTLAMDVNAIADPELGAVIDTVEVTTGGTVDDAALLECVRESALSMVLPAPEGGSVAFMVSMRLP